VKDTCWADIFIRYAPIGELSVPYYTGEFLRKMVGGVILNKNGKEKVKAGKWVNK
jgi:hypothetical protein